MKMYDFKAPNAQKVRIYAAEKGIDLAYEQVDVINHALRTPEMLKKNPLATVPFLELDDGHIIRESRAIIEYFEALHPDPPMLGTSPLERARVQELDRIAELGLMIELGHYVHNISPFFADKGPQSPEAAEMARNCYTKNLAIMDDDIGDNKFVAGDEPTIADCTLYSSLTFADEVQIPLDEKFANICRWRAEFAARPSAAA